MRISSSHLPSEWLIVPIEKIANKVTDGEHLTPERSESGILLLSARNIQDCFLSLKEVDYVPETEYQRIIKRCNPEYGDVFISCSGTIGRVCIVPQNLKFTLVRSAALIKPGNKINSDFLGHVLRSSFVQNQISRALNQSAQANLFINHINSLVIPLPPLPEQCKIADILGAWDDAIALLEKLITAKRKLKQGLMQQLLTGKKRFKEFEGSEWEKSNFMKTTKYYKGYTYKSNEYSDTETNTYLITLKCIGKGGGFQNIGLKYFNEKVNSKFEVFEGDLLFANTDLTRDAEVVGAPVLVPDLKGKRAMISMDLTKVAMVEDKMYKPFLYYSMKLSSIRNSFRAMASGSTVLHLDTNATKKIDLNLPGIKEQEKIASVLSAADTEISNLEKQLAAYKQQKRGLMQQLLTGKTRVRVN